MEKFRAFLEVAKKYHFWVLCGTIVLIAFGSWYLSTADTATFYNARKTKIETAFKGAAAISSNSNHPSTTYIQAIQLRTTGDVAHAPPEVQNLAGIHDFKESLLSNVTIANTRLFEEQGRNNGLPPVYADPEYQASFEKAFRTIWNHKIEEIEKQPPLDVNYRNQYRDRIKDFFPKLFDIIERRKEVRDKDEPVVANPRGGMGGFGKQDDRSKRYEGIVDWPDADKLMERFQKWNDTPTTLQVMLAQEDLWVYEALLRVIHNTNDFGSDAKHDPKNYRPPASHKAARIKEILALEIGNDAVQSWVESDNKVVVLPTEGSADPRGGAAPTQAAPMTRGGTVSYLSGGGQTGSPLAGRYVDNNGKPLTDPTQQPNDEFRMMPIDMRLIIEQKEIPRLLVECANSNMRIDVRSVRILIEKPPAFDLMAGGGAAPASGMGPPAGDAFSRGASSRGGEGRSGGGRSGGDANLSEESADAIYPPVPVEIQGIIYIYNPPENQGGENGGQAEPAAGGVPPAGAVPPGSAAPTPAGNIAPPTGAVRPAAGAPAVPPAGAAPAGAAPAGAAPAPAPFGAPAAGGPNPPNNLGPAPVNPAPTAPGPPAPAAGSNNTPANGGRP